MRSFGLLALLALLVLLTVTQPAHAASRRKQCARQCGPAIDACIAGPQPAGRKPKAIRRKCRESVLKRCRKKGLATCTSTTTTTTLPATSTCPNAVTSGSATIATSDGQVHTYFYRIPATAPPSAGYPVLFWLHGDGGTGDGNGSGFYPHTDPDAAILLTPSGVDFTWTHAADDLPGMPQDSQFISRIIDTLLSDGVGCATTIDAGRIYLGGESRGAYMPYFLLQRPSTKNRIAAVAVNAGLLYCQAGDGHCNADASDAALHDAKTPILHLHGTDDTLVAPPPTATFHDPVDFNVDYLVFYPMKLWAQQSGCFDANLGGGQNDGVLRETYTVNGRTAQRYDLTGWAPKCSKYQLILVTNGGHVIGGQYERIWNFLKGHALGSVD